MADESRPARSVESPPRHGGSNPPAVLRRLSLVAGNLDSNAAAETLGFLRRSVSELGQSIVMVTHDPHAAAYADRVVFLADGLVVGDLSSPTAETVLEQMKLLRS